MENPDTEDSAMDLDIAGFNIVWLASQRCLLRGMKWR